MNTRNQPAPGVLLNQNGEVCGRPSGLGRASAIPPSAKKKRGIRKPTAAPSSKSSQATGVPSRSSPALSKPDKLVCRYCGSDDLAPSFKKRHDGRCRACFKQRYGSKARDKNEMHRTAKGQKVNKG